jgi:hypothetical protein
MIISSLVTAPSVAFCTLVLGLASCETVGSNPSTFDPKTKEAVVDDARVLMEEQKAVLTDIENTSKLSYMLAETEGKPDEKARASFNDRVQSLEARIATYKARLDAFDRDTLAMTQRWREGMTSIRDKELDRVSRQNLDDSRKAYDEMNRALRENLWKMERIAKELNDHKVFLQVNPVADASGTLKDKLRPMNDDISDLRRDIDRSEKLIAEYQKKLRQ